ncbi:MAG TPA: SGNH/GDSL hydrolase family protein [Terriglobales bacterium]|jgi:lysophospholipase L1-like esterase|nr:SGNH/GDSL hydrolase family protein [Terriglobales bacterium]
MASFRQLSLVVGVLVLLLTRALAQGPGSLERLVLAQAQTSPEPAPQTTAQTTPAPQDDSSKLRSDLKMAQDKLKDWPNLGRYQDANAQIQPPAAGENRVVFMGDSITDNWGRKFGKFFPGKPYINRGIGGQTTPQMLIRFRPDVIALKPKVVVVLAGTNDIAGNTGPSTLEAIENNLASMAELARVNGIRVVLASLLPVCDYIKPQTARRPPEQIVALNDWMKDYAAKNGLVYLDYYSSLLDDKKMFKQELTNDGLHPNDAGYQVMGPLAEKAIAAALRSTASSSHKKSGKKGSSEVGQASSH